MSLRIVNEDGGDMGRESDGYVLDCAEPDAKKFTQWAREVSEATPPPGHLAAVCFRVKNPNEKTLLRLEAALDCDAKLFRWEGAGIFPVYGVSGGFGGGSVAYLYKRAK